MKSKFDFYEIVRVSSKKEALKVINYKEGVIIGKSQDEEDPRIFYYAVDIINDSGEIEDGWSIEEIDLKETGKKADPAKFAYVDSVKIVVDPDTGEGKVIDAD